MLNACPQSCISNHVEGLLEVYEDMVEVLLVLEIFITDDSRLKRYLLGGAPLCPEACLLFSDNLRLRLQTVQYDLQHDFA